MLPGCTEAWAPPELLFGAAPQRARFGAACAFRALKTALHLLLPPCAELSHLRAFGLSTPPADEALGEAPAMPGAW
jgi:hypothetical protein